MISQPEPPMWQVTHFATIRETAITIILCRIVKMVNGKRRQRVAESERSSDEDSEELWKDYPCLNPFGCFLVSPCLIFFHFSILLLASGETDRVKNKTPDTYFTPKLFTNGAKRTRRTTTSRFWVIVIWSSALKCVCIRFWYSFVGCSNVRCSFRGAS
jgi:hypothetical protein